ncbi:hypothetical protein Goari_022169 [Gossypium aridum]|uniref:RNase H type-1 domain-containing protein n=1 Tax=Gossypium aridum TaxID=34290 RepID=A0A7J8YTE4_GOSAI|nr:hypothetical protein [Gossypium aridum]
MDWMIVNKESNVGLHVGIIEWGMYFVVLCWFLWKNRSRTIFQHDSVYPKKILRRTESLVTNICSMMRTDSLKSPNRSIYVKWNPPKKGWVKVNTDGASIDNGNYSTIGGVLRDFHVARHRGYPKVILVSDNKVKVDMLNVNAEDVMMFPSSGVLK